MSISALSNAGFSSFVQSASDNSGVKKTLQTLQQNLGSGDLAAAQTAFNQLQQIVNSQASLGGSSKASASTVDLSTLGSALTSGNVSSAQTALSAVQSDLTGANSPSVAAALNAGNQAVAEIDVLLNLSSAGTAANASDPLLGASTSSSSSDPTTSILNSVYGTASYGTSTTGTSSTNVTSGTNVNTSA